jgi:hypothetical protein
MNPSVANRDSRAAVIAALSAGVMMAQLVAGKATRDTLFLSAFGARGLPRVMIAAAVLALVAVLASGRLMVRFSPARVVPAAFYTSALLFVLEWLLLARWPAATAFLIYLHIVAFSAILSSGFWSVVSERFDPHAARAVVSRITLGGSLGGLLGGLFGWQLASSTSVPSVLWLLAVLGALAALGISRFAREGSVGRRARDDQQLTRPPSALQLLGRAPYLRNVATVVLLGAAVQALLDYSVGVHAGAVFPTRDGLMGFFSLFYALAGIVGVGVQLTLAPVILARWGIALGAALLPVSVMVAAVAALFVPGPISAALARGIEAVARNSVYRASYELLYTPLPPEAKRPTKALIDVGFDRVGTATGSAAVLLCIAISSEQAWRLALGVAIVLSAAGAYAAMRLRKGYVTTLADGLRRGLVQMSPEWTDARTLDTLTATAGALDRRTLLQEIERLHQRELAAGARALEPAATGAAAAILALTCGEPDRVRKVLAGDGPFAPVLVAPAIDLLDNEVLAPDAVGFLRKHAVRASGQLVDALLDGARPLPVRRRLARVLAACPDQRCVDGLLAALSDDRLEVRRACARALFELTAHEPALRIDAERVRECVLRELRLAQVQPAGGVWSGEEDELPAEGDSAPRHQGDRSLECAFRMLSLVLERDPVWLAWKGLRTGDRTLRGTALEYLDNVLARDVRDALFARLEIRAEPGRRTRSRAEAEQDLLRSRASIELQLGQGRRGNANAG